MQNKRMIFIMGVVVLVVGVAAVIGGRMLNDKNAMTDSVHVIPAEELPKAIPELVGQFIERQDNRITIQSISMAAGGAGGIVTQDEEGGGYIVGNGNEGPKVEVIITNETAIYGENTHPPSGDDQTIQQTVEESTLDELHSQAMVRVWGRRNGERIIADVLYFKGP